MIVIPLSTALTLSRPPWVTYATAALCVLIFIAQLSDNSVTEIMLYYPQSWNPLNMVSYALAHGSWMHLIGNMIFYLAFAPALETLIDNRLRYVRIMLFIAVCAAIGYSVSMAIGANPDIPTLGFSGVVTGMIGLSAYLMPQARIRVFWWYVFGGSILYVPAWTLAVFYIGMDSWTMFTASDYGGINVVAHVIGGLAGYLYGVIWLKQRREETREELSEEIEAMKVRQHYGKDREDAYRSKKKMQQRELQKQAQRDHDKFLASLYQKVKTNRDSEAMLQFLERYDDSTQVPELEQLYTYFEQWGPSRFLLCIGRMIIDRLDREQRHGRAIVFIEKGQQINPQFLIADISRVPHYAQLAKDAGKPEIAQNLMHNARKRYGKLISGNW
ncbi:MAG: rhomboid family intramembrane serine protease [Gammaproteobacteria bacterium]|nr:rhomboid family intramembrane serine protease [Gammaproteobacteria bacterium]